MKKDIVGVILLLFIGVTVAPSINFNLVKASHENDLITVTTQAYMSGKGYLPHDPIHIAGDENFTVENGVVSGNGTEDNPYLIQGWQIDSSGNQSDIGIWIENTSNYFIIRNCSIQELPHAGINLTSVINGQIELSAIDSHTYSYPEGIFLVNCSSVVVSLNKVGAYTGIHMHQCRSIVVRQNTIQGTHLYEGIKAQDCLSLSFLNNTILDFGGLGSNGFFIYSNNFTLSGNSIHGVGDGAGIRCGGTNIRLENNSFIHCGFCGQVSDSAHVYIGYNYMSNSGDGFALGRSKDCLIENNIVKYNALADGIGGGLGCGRCSNVTFRNNIISHVPYGLWYAGSNNSIYGNHISATVYGVYFDGTTEPGTDEKPLVSDNLIWNNTITAHKYGIYLNGRSQRNTFTMNSINGSDHDVYLQDWSKDNRFIYNNFLSMNDSSHCYFKLRLNSVKEVWDANYWGRPQVFPVVILGVTGLFRWMLFPWFQIEKNPTKTPYTVPN